MRGVQSLFNDHINPEPTPRKGRSETLINERNDALVVRYYFYRSFSSLRYSAILERLRKEFFIAEYTIIDILKANNEAFPALKGMDVEKFKGMYPHFNWNIKSLQ